MSRRCGVKGSKRLHPIHAHGASLPRTVGEGRPNVPMQRSVGLAEGPPGGRADDSQLKRRRTAWLNDQAWLSHVERGIRRNAHRRGLFGRQSTPTTAPTTKPATAVPPTAAAPTGGARRSSSQRQRHPARASSQPSAEASTAASSSRAPRQARPRRAPRIRRRLVQPGDPSAITDSYPDYGDPIDCAAGTWNGLPVHRRPEVDRPRRIRRPSSSRSATRTSRSCPRSRSQCSAINDSA